MRAEDVTDTLDMALAASGCDQAHVQHRPRLLSDNGPSCIAGELEHVPIRWNHLLRKPMRKNKEIERPF